MGARRIPARQRLLPWRAAAPRQCAGDADRARRPAVSREHLHAGWCAIGARLRVGLSVFGAGRTPAGGGRGIAGQHAGLAAAEDTRVRDALQRPEPARLVRPQRRRGGAGGGVFGVGRDRLRGSDGGPNPASVDRFRIRRRADTLHRCRHAGLRPGHAGSRRRAQDGRRAALLPRWLADQRRPADPWGSQRLARVDLSADPRGHPGFTACRAA